MIRREILEQMADTFQKGLDSSCELHRAVVVHNAPSPVLLEVKEFLKGRLKPSPQKASQLNISEYPIICYNGDYRQRPFAAASAYNLDVSQYFELSSIRELAQSA